MIIYDHKFIQNRENRSIYFDLFAPDKEIVNQPTILFLHGFKGFKNWGAWSDAMQWFTNHGFAAIAMNFSRNGLGDNKNEFIKPEDFAEQTLTSDLNDVLDMLAAIKKNRTLFASFNPYDIRLIGHSRGGHTAFTATAENKEQIQGLVTWSAVANYNRRWSDKMKSDWQTKGFTEILNARTKQWLAINKTVFDDSLLNQQRLMADIRASELEIPVLIIHGKNDPAVSIKEAQELYKATASENKELILIENAGHTFETAHPHSTGQDFPEPFQHVLDESLKFLKKISN